MQMLTEWHQLETPESNVHRVPTPWMTNNNSSPVTPESDSLVSSAMKGCGSEENARKAAPYSDVVTGLPFFYFYFVRS
jgi:hypothetical protein